MHHGPEDEIDKYHGSEDKGDGIYHGLQDKRETIV